MIKSPNCWSCMPASFAMFFNISLKEILDALGHDGSKRLWPALPEPFCHRGFHIQEFIRFGLINDVKIIGVEAYPVQAVPGFTNTLDHTDFFSDCVTKNKGVLTGRNRAGSGHAVFWDGQKIYDPSGSIYDLGNQCFVPDTFWF